MQSPTSGQLLRWATHSVIGSGLQDIELDLPIDDSSVHDLDPIPDECRRQIGRHSVHVRNDRKVGSRRRSSRALGEKHDRFIEPVAMKLTRQSKIWYELDAPPIQNEGAVTKHDRVV